MKKATETNPQTEGLVKLAREMGALDAKLIDPKNVVVADWVRLKCQFGCYGYGKTLTCPPYSPTPEQTRRVLANYTRALLLRLPDESLASHDLLANLERTIFLEGYYNAFAMPAGPCMYCEKCNLKTCMHARKARPSMEACGIDVYATARKNGYKIEVRKSEEEKPTYYGLLLIE